MTRTTQPAAEPSLLKTPAIIGLLLAPGGGFLAHLAFSPYDLWPLLPVGIALLIVACTVRSPWLAGLQGVLWGLGLFIPLTEWANIYAGVGPWLLLGAVEALYLVLFAVAVHIVLHRRGLTPVTGVLIAAIWAAVEQLRSSWPYGGLSWGASAFAMPFSPMLGYAPWLGFTGLAVLAGWLGALLAGSLLALTGRRRRGIQGGAGLLPLAVAAAVVAGGIIVPSPRNPVAETPSLLVAGIQGTAPGVDLGSYQMPEEMLENHVATTDRAVQDVSAQGRTADLVVWPEDSTGWDPREDPRRGALITQAAQNAQAPILIGTQTAEGENYRYNNAVLWGPQGPTDYQYSKRHPVPFGEYLPLRDLISSITDKADLIGMDMLPGTEVGVFDLAADAATGDGGASASTGEESTSGPQIGVLICFEIAYAPLVHDVVDGGAEVIVVQSNTALFGTSHEPEQQLAQSTVMAAMSGRTVVHAATAGPSAIIAPNGRVLAQVDHFDQGAVIADVPLYRGTTPAMAMGPWGWVVVSAIAIAGVLAAFAAPRGQVGTPGQQAHSTGRGRR